MIDYGDLEDEISAFLGGVLTGVDCSGLPEVQEDFQRGRNPQVMVCYSHSKFSDPKRMGGIQQDETLFFDIIIRATKLRSSTGIAGIYPISRILRSKLLGYRPTDCTEVTFLENGRAGSEDDFKDGVWTHCLCIQFKAYAAQVEDAEIAILLTQARFNDEYGGAGLPNPDL